jgi:dephospho-CoA kinase
MLVIGLTGGIGSGKSTVARLFTQHGVAVLDTDQVARQVVAPGAPALAEIRDSFGAEVLTANGELDRRAMRERVFRDPQAREKLEAITHPRIRDQVRQWLAQQNGDYCIVIIPLLLEKGWTELIDRILVVDVPEALQLERTIQRDGMNRDQVEAIMATQVSRQTRLDAADDIIHNDGDITALRARVDALHEKYLGLKTD